MPGLLPQRPPCATHLSLPTTTTISFASDSHNINRLSQPYKRGTAMAINGHVNGDAATPKGPNYERVQIINDEKQFIPELTQQIERWDLHSAGFDYDIVAVFGSQSTGKSTLLNRLFGTNFDVMDETRRQQTTKGIWMCRAKGMNVMVMDVEGTDGRERGEDQDFERKSALFSLASSEVLIVNLWEHQVGLYQGANMGLLKTVFEVNLGIFGKKTADGRNQRTLLLFAIRDHIGTTPLANLQATLTADLQKIWETLSKPPELQDRQLSDYFDLSFVALPHKILAADKFESEVQELRKRFMDKGREDYVFKPAYHKRIPADGVAFYMEGIWEQVQTNKDLDLPTQQELLAQFRCDEISAAALTEFNEQAKPQRRPIESGKVIENLGGMMRAWRSGALERYDRDASRYHQGVYKRKRADLVSVLDSTLSPLFLGQLKNLHKASLVTFKKEMLEGMRGENYNFAEVVAAARERCEKRFLDGAQEALVEGTDWNYEEELELLRNEIRIVADQCRKDETKKMVNAIERNIKKQISDPVEIWLNKPQPDMWDEILKVFRELLEKAESMYLTKAKSFNCTDEENETSLAILRKRAWLALRAKVDEQTTDAAFLTKLRTHFEERFRYDEHGVPRVWKPSDDIDGAFKKARDQTLELIPLYSRINPIDGTLEYSLPSEESDPLSSTDEFDFPATLVIFSETKILDLMSRFRRDADAYYVEAKRSMVSSVAQIPYWMYGVLVVLGWNEAMFVLFNPLYFAMLLCMVGAAYIVVQLGMAGPLLQITRTLVNEVQSQAYNHLRDHFSQPHLTEPVRAQAVMQNEVDPELRDRKTDFM
ncbi:root hair defective 3 GTP-binding protein [Laetiporus sulphureus 93-53]|uniref:Root hair defective 3 GTP-binding protein n=1 Tax=Laetiporus sulphureus 93-53 TaxID=1314785 RepID=A0A165GTP6_9APHY|nr:root hair defective 3 GTP-binding protein [Laetiporus sulphureus 93-53]KZT10800.1 root hair defective 3 GTP-binding protein [Laetiporus sulphureus 93-53]